MKSPTRFPEEPGKIHLDRVAYRCDIPIRVGAPGSSRLEAALWWPEEMVHAGRRMLDTHNNIDLEVLDPRGKPARHSRSVGGVFERATVPGPIAPGTWTLRVTGTSLRLCPQPVYWTVALRSGAGVH